MSSKSIFQRAAAVVSLAMLAILPLSHTADAATPNYGYAAVQVAKAKVGDPYVYGAAGPNSFDCSGLSQYSYEHGRVRHYLPRTADAQYRYAKKVSYSQRRPGDLVFFHSSNGYVFHVGVYVGMRKDPWGHWRSYMIHAPRPGSHVKYEPIYEGWGYSYVTFGRI